MKTVAILAFATLLASCTHGQEKPIGADLNAYQITFLDSESKPLANATILTKEFKKQDREAWPEKCEMLLLENENKGAEVSRFKSLIPNRGQREIEIETKKEPEFGSGGHVLIEFHPRTNDSNIHVILNLDKRPIEGNWGYALFEGGFTGGKVRVARIHAKPIAATEEGRPDKQEEVKVPRPDELPHLSLPP